MVVATWAGPLCDQDFLDDVWISDPKAAPSNDAHGAATQGAFGSRLASVSRDNAFRIDHFGS